MHYADRESDIRNLTELTKAAGGRLTVDITYDKLRIDELKIVDDGALVFSGMNGGFETPKRSEWLAENWMDGVVMTVANGCRIVTPTGIATVVASMTFDDYVRNFGDEYEDGTLWDFAVSEIVDGTVEAEDVCEYWYIDGRLYETFNYID